MRDGLSRFSRGARGAAAKLPRPAREALRRLLGIPPSDWVGRDPAHWAAASAPALELENRHEVLLLGSPGGRPEQEQRDALARRLAASGHRVFRVASDLRAAGAAYVVSEERPGLFAVSLRGPEEERFSAIDSLRRDLGLGATASITEDPSWLPISERLCRELGWAHSAGTSDPAALARAFKRISIVVVTYDNRDLNRLCLESLRARTEWPNTETIVVDNGSTDGTPELLTEAAQADPRLRVIQHETNLGFAAACNAGLAAATGEYLVLLNNDTVVTRGWATTLARHLGADPGLGLVGPVTNAIANSARVEAGYTGMRDLPQWAAAWTRAHDGEIFELPMLALFCAAMRRGVFEQIGPLDERFGIGMFEDDDYCRRMRDAGYRIACARDAFVHHWQMASFRKMPRAAYFALFRENRKKYEAKWGRSSAPSPERETARPRRESPERPRRQLPALLERIRASRGAVIFLPSIGWQTPLLQRPHHLARVFARKGHVAIFDGSNVGDRVEGFQEIEPNLFLFGGDGAVLHEVPSPLIWALPYNFPLAGAYPRGSRIVYDWIDDLSVFPIGRRTLARNHARALRDASLVVAVSRRLHDEALRTRKDALYLPNGVEYELFASPARPARDETFDRFLAGNPPVAGYYGALASWFDDGLLADAAARRPDWRFVLIGPRLDSGPRGKRLRTRDNVLWLGPRDYFALPGYLDAFDVATIPFRLNPITLATSPLKLYEYFAAGKPVVATAMPECEAFPEVAIVRDGREFAEALDRMRAKGKDPLFRAHLRELGRANSWEARVETVLERLVG